jgi:flavin-dependent dehydrogenase
MIETLGVDLSMASTISAVRLAHGNRIATTRLPFTARGMSRHALDEALLRQAQASGATVLRGHRVGAIQQDHGSLRLECGTLRRLVADTVFLATGKHELRGAGRPAPLSWQTCRSARFRCRTTKQWRTPSGS